MRYCRHLKLSQQARHHPCGISSGLNMGSSVGPPCSIAARLMLLTASRHRLHAQRIHLCALNRRPAAEAHRPARAGRHCDLWPTGADSSCALNATASAAAIDVRPPEGSPCAWHPGKSMRTQLQYYAYSMLCPTACMLGHTACMLCPTACSVPQMRNHSIATHHAAT
jgi:hypothetical protein